MRKDRSLKVILSLLQVVASKYMNDEGEMEALTNSDWAKLGTEDFPVLAK